MQGCQVQKDKVAKCGHKLSKKTSQKLKAKFFDGNLLKEMEQIYESIKDLSFA